MTQNAQHLGVLLFLTALIFVATVAYFNAKVGIVLPQTEQPYSSREDILPASLPEKLFPPLSPSQCASFNQHAHIPITIATRRSTVPETVPDYLYTVPDYRFEPVRGSLFIGEAEPLHITHLKSMPPTSVYVDIGSNSGDYTLAAAAMGHRVFSFEPIPYSVFLICNSMYLNQFFDRVSLYWAAAGEDRDNITLYSPVGREDNTAINPATASTNIKDKPIASVTVQKLRVGELLLERSDLTEFHMIKIDVQGSEYRVLQGLEPFLRKHVSRTLIYSEWDLPLMNNAAVNPQELIMFMKSVGFLPYRSSERASLMQDRDLMSFRGDIFWQS